MIKTLFTISSIAFALYAVIFFLYSCKPKENKTQLKDPKEPEVKEIKIKAQPFVTFDDPPIKHVIECTETLIDFLGAKNKINANECKTKFQHFLDNIIKVEGREVGLLDLDEFRHPLLLIGEKINEGGAIYELTKNDEYWGEHNPYTEEKVKKMLERASKLGFHYADYDLSMGYLKDKKEALSRLVAVYSHIPDAQQIEFNIANKYLDINDTENGLKWFLKGADKNCSMCLRHLGYLYSRGKHTKVNKAEAEKWFRKAIEAGELDLKRDLEKL